MLWSEIMPSRYVRNHRTRRNRLGNDPPFLLIAPPSAADRARYLRAALNDLRVVTNVDHNLHTILSRESRSCTTRLHLKPNPIDQNPWAHWRSPMDMMRQG